MTRCRAVIGHLRRPPALRLEVDELPVDVLVLPLALRQHEPGGGRSTITVGEKKTEFSVPAITWPP